MKKAEVVARIVIRLVSVSSYSAWRTSERARAALGPRWYSGSRGSIANIDSSRSSPVDFDPGNGAFSTWYVSVGLLHVLAVRSDPRAALTRSRSAEIAGFA